MRILWYSILNTMRKKQKTQIVWISKHWNSRGVYQAEVIPISEVPGLMRKADDSRVLFSADYWHTTRAKAVAKANQLRRQKIKYLKEQLEKLKIPIT